LKNKKIVGIRDSGLAMLLGFIDNNGDLGELTTNDLIKKIRKELEENYREKNKEKKKKEISSISEIIKEIESIEKKVLKSNNGYTKAYSSVVYDMPIYVQPRPILSLLAWSSLDSCLSNELRQAYKKVKKIKDLEESGSRWYQRIKDMMSYTSDSLGAHETIFRGKHSQFSFQASDEFLEDIFNENLRIALKLKNRKWDNQILFDTYVAPKRPGRVYYSSCIELLYQIAQQLQEGAKKEKLAGDIVFDLYDKFEHPIDLSEVRKSRIKKKIHLDNPAVEYVKIRGLLAFLDLLSKS
jgi:hypothetical protein